MFASAALPLVVFAAQVPASGPVTTDFDRRDDSAQAVAVQPDGRLVVAGSAHDRERASVALSRYLEDGHSIRRSAAMARSRRTSGPPRVEPTTSSYSPTGGSS